MLGTVDTHITVQLYCTVDSLNKRTLIFLIVINDYCGVFKLSIQSQKGSQLLTIISVNMLIRNK
jgi:preprotein translocase subunit SecB